MPRFATRSRQIDHYELKDKLGEGAGGVVYRAYDTALQRTVVVKLLHRSRTVERNMLPLIEEARLASAIDHPNVCTVFDVGETEGRPYLVMQYVSGKPLSDYIQSGPLPLPLVLSFSAQIASGLAAAHRRGILHRDLKPANVMVTEEGLAKILDFGLARRAHGFETGGPVDGGTGTTDTPFGTTAYMAPEQFVTRRSSEQTDLWALGVIMFEMVNAHHPFWSEVMDPAQMAHAIQSRPLPDLRRQRPELDPALVAVIERLLARDPHARYQQATEVRDALRSLARAHDVDLHGIPDELPVFAAAQTDDARTGFFTAIAERLLPARQPVLPENAIVVLPFERVGAEVVPEYYGLALAETIATRLAGFSDLEVRSPRLVPASLRTSVNPEQIGRALSASFIISGDIIREAGRIHVSWRLLSATHQSVLTGGSVDSSADQLVAVQHEISDEIVTAIAEAGHLPIVARPVLRSSEAVGEADLPPDLVEDYLGGRALLNSQITRSSHEEDLLQARAMFERVTKRAPDFAPAHASLGIALTRYVRFGFAGVTDLIAAQRHLERALQLDPGNIEAKLYRAYTMLWRGEKEKARRDVQYLVKSAPYDAEVYLVAGIILHLDGLLGPSIQTLSMALRTNPTIAPRVYNLRARVYIYQQKPEEARAEIDRGLAVEPGHTLLRTTSGVWHLRHGELATATELLEGVVRDDPNLRLVHPTLAIAYWQDGRRDEALRLMNEETLATASADCEMAYRVATFYAVARDETEALHWLRRSIYLGNHNAPWFLANPHWEAVRDHPDIRRTLDELAENQRQYHERWRRLLG